MKTIVAGGRDITDLNLVRKAIEDSGFIITELVCGMARGVDQLGLQIALKDGIPVKKFPANWDKYGSSAGPIRNQEMAKCADALILVWDGKSKGSSDMLRQAILFRLKIHSHIIK